MTKTTKVSGAVTVVQSERVSLVVNAVEGGWRVEAKQPRTFATEADALAWARKRVVGQ